MWMHIMTESSPPPYSPVCWTSPLPQHFLQCTLYIPFINVYFSSILYCLVLVWFQRTLEDLFFRIIGNIGL
ncbi:unnamed protein product [Penicillium nalgiovense]|nr:unnamed protein product [Penicillium nalgiovense]